MVLPYLFREGFAGMRCTFSPDIFLLDEFRTFHIEFLSKMRKKRKGKKKTIYFIVFMVLLIKNIV